MRAVTETGSGLLVAVGWSGLAGAIWTSRDGMSWTRMTVAAFQPLAGSIRLDGIADDGSGTLIAVGRQEHATEQAGIWVSDDAAGRSWRRLRSDDAFSDRGEAALDVAVTDAGVVGVGYGHHDSIQNAAA